MSARTIAALVLAAGVGSVVALAGASAGATGAAGPADDAAAPHDAVTRRDAGGRESVVVLHGLARGKGAMEPLADRLEAAGYRVVNVDYPSTRLGPDDLAPYLAGVVASCCADAPRLHFVTHSLGGIMVRAYLAAERPANLGRVVMLAPPNHGSELVDALDSAAFRSALGPTAVELGTDAESLPNRLPDATFELGVIAGTGSVNPIGSMLVPGDDDGTVSVQSTRLDGMVDFVTLEASHTFIMRSPEAARQVVEFLRHGRFDHAGTPAAAPDPVSAGPP